MGEGWGLGSRDSDEYGSQWAWEAAAGPGEVDPFRADFGPRWGGGPGGILPGQHRDPDTGGGGDDDGGGGGMRGEGGGAAAW